MRVTGPLVFCLMAATGLLAQPLRAEDVTLTSLDGGVEVQGSLLSFDGEVYRLDSRYGPLSINAEGVVCSGPGCPDLEAFVTEFAISGDAAISRVLMPALISAFARSRGLTVLREVADDTRSTFSLSDPTAGRVIGRISLHVSSTAEGFADLLSGEADIALAMRLASQQEAALAQEAGQGDLNRSGRAKVLALDAVIPIVSTAHRQTALAVETLFDMLGTGRDPAEGPLHLPGQESGAGEALAELVPEADQTPASRHDDPDEIARAVTADPAALGLTLFSEVGNADPLKLMGQCGFELEATPTTLKSEDYPFTTPLLYYTSRQRLPLLAREFLRFFDAPSAAIVIRRAGFVDQTLDRIDRSEQGDRLANAIAGAGSEVSLGDLQRFVTLTQGADRLTTAFRFTGGSATLDAQSLGNVNRLARAIETGAFDRKELLFIGFSDGNGPAAANLRLSRSRANSVLEAVQKAAVTAEFNRVSMATDAFGEAFPIACDDSDWGRRVNRRVEVWIRDHPVE